MHRTALICRFNKKDHPIAFHKGDMFAGKKKIADTGPAPDNDQVFEEDEAVPDDEEDAKDGDDENDVGKDKMIKAVKPKGKGKTAEAKSKPKK